MRWWLFQTARRHASNRVSLCRRGIIDCRKVPQEGAKAVAGIVIDRSCDAQHVLQPARTSVGRARSSAAAKAVTPGDCSKCVVPKRTVRLRHLFAAAVLLAMLTISTRRFSAANGSVAFFSSRLP